MRARLATEEGSLAVWASSLAEGLLVVALLYGIWLLIIGMKSRLVALLLAALAAGSACAMHPFWYYMLAPAERTYKLGGVAGMEGYTVDSYTMADHQRYFFFQTMSTVGALLLLVVHGPGKHSLDEQHGPMVLPTAHQS